MRNRAKCRLCQSVIESYHYYDYVSCKCGEISVTGGPDSYQSASKDHSYKNFIRVDDEDNEVCITLVDTEEPKSMDAPKLTRDDYLKMLDSMIKSIESLPPQAMQAPISHYDLYSALLLLSTILRS